jgi:hypothetical protein
MTTDANLKTVYRNVIQEPLTFAQLKHKTKIGETALRKALSFWIDLKIVERVNLPKPMKNRGSGRNFPRYAYRRVAI